MNVFMIISDLGAYK